MYVRVCFGVCDIFAEIKNRINTGNVCITDSYLVVLRIQKHRLEFAGLSLPWIPKRFGVVAI